MAESPYDEWDRVYRKYPLEELPWELGRPREILVKLIEGGEVKKGKVLDICCGAGTNTVYLAQNGFDVVGLDISSNAIEYAREKAKKAGVEIKFHTGNFVSLPFEDNEFDFLLDMGCFHHVLPKDRVPYIRGVHRVLKSKGKYLLICFSYRNGQAWNHFTREQMIQHFSDYFNIISMEHLSSLEGDGVVRHFYSSLMEKNI